MAKVTKRGSPIFVSTRALQEKLAQIAAIKLRKVGTRHLTRRALVYATWDEETPKIAATVATPGVKVTLKVELIGGWTKGNLKWIWVGRGTDVRFATMHPDFKAKTKVGHIGSSAGAHSKPLFVNPLVPRPGIEARLWDERINKEDLPQLQVDILDILNQTFKGP